MLGNSCAPHLRNQVVAAADSSKPAKSPVVPPNTVLKKIELSLEQRCEFVPPALRASCPMAWEQACPDALRAPPLHPPPRVNVV